MYGSLSPRAFAFARLLCLYLMFDLQTFASLFVRRAPSVRGFTGDGRTSDLEKMIGNVNLLARTKLCKFMLRFGSDKSHFHNYTAIYSVLLRRFRNSSLKIVELGLGSNNLEVPSNMGLSGTPGASLRGWREYFPNALIYGADIDRSILFEEPRIKTFYCNQLDPAAISELWSNPDMKDGADIIIEDGLHTFEGNTSFLEGSLDYLRPEGIYIVEDIDRDDLVRWFGCLEAVYTKKYPECEFVVAALSADPEFRDDNLLIIHRRARRAPEVQ